MCGENSPLGKYAGSPVGSSPRVRGKPPTHRVHRYPCGLIPACAGKTPPRSDNGCDNRAHPRVCGENQLEASGMSVREGSSPRVRGKPMSDLRRRTARGLIPACAGKTRFREHTISEPRAHPRVCGENLCDRGCSRLCGGSSPRVRGKRALNGR